MRVTAVETVYWTGLHPQFIMVRVHTDEGLIGLGQTADYRTAGVLHDLAARYVIGRDPRDVERIWHDLFTFARFHGYAGAELRAISALDIALWDLLGQSLGAPIWQVLGGKVRPGIRVYNTCSAYKEFDDREHVRRDPVGLATELMDAGITALKYSPFDQYVAPSLGYDLSDAQIEEAIAPIYAIAERYGGRFEVAIEGHAVLSLPNALRVARVLERSGLPIMWLEDLTHPEHAVAWRSLKEETKIPICGSERLMTRHQLLPLLEARAIDVLMSDITWVGGISELRKTAVMAEPYGIPIAPHDHSGPVNLVASAHVLVHVPNAYVMESTRAFYRTYYPEIVTPGEFIRDGILYPPDGPGLGVALTDEALVRPDGVWKRSEA